MSKISKKLAQAIQQELVKFDGTHTDFLKAVEAAALDPRATKTTVDLAHQFIILGTFFHKVAGLPLSDTPNYGTEFEVPVAGNTLVRGMILDGESLKVITSGNVEFEAVSNKAAHIIKKWFARIALLQRHEMRRHKSTVKQLGKLLPKQSKADFIAKKAKAVAKAVAKADAAECLEIEEAA